MFEDDRMIRPTRGLLRRAAVLAVVLAALLSLCAAHAEAEHVVEGAVEHYARITGGLTSDEAAEGYINQILYPGARRPKGANLGAKLEGREGKLYAILAEKVQKVAEGELTSTVFSIPVKDVFEQVQFTADDLGVDALAEEINGSYYITEEAKNAFYEKIDVDVDAVYAALLNDFPYQMYWHDKVFKYESGGTVIHATSWGMPRCGWASTSPGDEWMSIYNYDTDTFEVKFIVAQEYSHEQADGYRHSGTYEYDTSFGTAVKAAADNAQGIVRENASLSDYDKLAAYKKAICDRVEYNHEAANNDDTPYGNPWQLVWVFDGNASTNVVCEGYSKAFQYLCDLSKFRGNVSAICATGMMYGGTGEGRHMWNIVTMEDGNNYLVDITNCDGDEESGVYSIGYPDYLFMKGYASAAQEYEQYYKQYNFNGSGTDSIAYEYDSDTLSTFGSTGRLALSGVDYVPGSEEEITPYPYTLTLPGDTETIGSQAFANLGIPVNVRIPESVTHIADDAFSGSDVVLIFGEAQGNAADLKAYAENENHPLPYIAEP